MAGEIHGIISRDTAWSQWDPYGQRVALDGYIDPSQLTNLDARHIVLGADEETQGIAYSFWCQENEDGHWLDGVAEIDLPDEPELYDTLMESHERQQQLLAKLREMAIEQGSDYIKLIQGGACKLRDSGLLTPAQATCIEGRLLGPDGLPAIQYTPMSQVEYSRLARTHDGEELDIGSTDSTDFAFGIIRSTVRFYSDFSKRRAHTRVHETVHGFSGIEVHDITRDDGWRLPSATVVGTFAFNPTTQVSAGDDYSKVENAELNEGWADFMARELTHVEPRLGSSPPVAEGYSDWAEQMRLIAKYDPYLFKVITDTTLVDSSPATPHAKREAIARMHAIADRIYGQPDALNTIFQTAGGSILDIYNKGKRLSE